MYAFAVFCNHVLNRCRLEPMHLPVVVAVSFINFELWTLAVASSCRYFYDCLEQLKSKSNFKLLSPWQYRVSEYSNLLLWPHPRQHGFMLMSPTVTCRVTNFQTAFSTLFYDLKSFSFEVCRHVGSEIYNKVTNEKRYRVRLTLRTTHRQFPDTALSVCVLG